MLSKHEDSLRNLKAAIFTYKKQKKVKDMRLQKRSVGFTAAKFDPIGGVTKTMVKPAYSKIWRLAMRNGEKMQVLVSPAMREVQVW